METLSKQVYIGFTWIPIYIYIYIWIPMDSYGIPMDFYGFLWIAMEFLWIPMVYDYSEEPVLKDSVHVLRMLVTWQGKPCAAATIFHRPVTSKSHAHTVQALALDVALRFRALSS
jgi:hypothetical protein